MLEELEQNIRVSFAERTLAAHVDIKTTKGADDRLRELILAGGVPLAYSNHQMHTDGIAWAGIANYLRQFTGSFPQNRQLRGLSVLLATSMTNGQQGEELKTTFDMLVEGAKRMGMIPVPATREKDAVLYGMSRTQILREVKPLFENLRERYGIGCLPEGTVEGGRHPEGEDIENIYGMQEVGNDNLIAFNALASKRLRPLGERVFYLPVALHGGYRLMQAPKDGKPRLTAIGRISLITGVIGLSLQRIRATLLMPFTDEDAEKDLGTNWMKNGSAFNRYAMEKLKPGLPPVAWGVYY